MNLENQTALVTGSSGNIGRAVAKVMAEAGADVGITAFRNREGCEETAREVEASGSRASVSLADLSEPAEINAMVSAIRDDLGPIDVLVNNAAIRPEIPFLELEPDDWDRVHAVNLRSTYQLSKQVIPDMIAADGGSIIDVLGVTAFYGDAGKSHVHSTKLGSVGLIRSLATEFGPDNIRVNGVSPGAMDTERDPGKYSDELLDKAIVSTPLERLGDPRELGDACCFLASDRASFITGQVLHVNGGLFPAGNLYT